MRKTADSEVQTPDQPNGSLRRKRRRPTGATECAFGVMLGLAALAFSRLGQLWTGFDVFSHFTLHFMLLTFGFLVGFVLPRGKLFGAALLLVAGVVAIGAWPHVASLSPKMMASAAPGEAVLRVASFNTLWSNANARAIQAEIERLDADVVALVEVGAGARAMLASLKARYPYQADCLEIDFCGLALLSKRPIARSEARANWEGPPFIMARLGPDAGGLTVLGVHTSRFPHSETQFRQTKAMAALIEALPGPKLVMGDFNATPFSRLLGDFASRATLRRITYLPSWPATANLPQIAIDHIFLSPGLRQLEAARIGEASGSDHFPVTALIAVPVPR